MDFLPLHDWWSWVMVSTNAVAGVWALTAHYRPAVRHRAMWIVTIVAQVSVAVQAVLGVLVLQVDGRDVDQLHVIYGFVALAAIGILYSYRQQIMEWQYLLYGCGGLFLMGMGIRGMILSPV
ncbi:MAG: hypothetical protein AAF962_15720 [Actinomycetota bacterium]